MTSEMDYKILDQIREICGKRHRLVERRDGFRFYLDDAFLFALESFSFDDLHQELSQFGVEPGEIPLILSMLKKAGLTGEDIHEH
jgi:hypothetical protein